eukprot:884982-Ditylum_brightwellii.AAC.1
MNVPDLQEQTLHDAESDSNNDDSLYTPSKQDGDEIGDSNQDTITAGVYDPNEGNPEHKNNIDFDKENENMKNNNDENNAELRNYIFSNSAEIAVGGDHFQSSHDLHNNNENDNNNDENDKELNIHIPSNFEETEVKGGNFQSFANLQDNNKNEADMPYTTEPTNFASSTNEQNVPTEDDNLVGQDNDIQNDNLGNDENENNPHLIAETNTGQK